MRYLYFRSWNDAVSRAANEGWKQRPQKRTVWLDRDFEEVWSLEVPDETDSLALVRNGNLPDVPQANPCQCSPVVRTGTGGGEANCKAAGVELESETDGIVR
jgi:hypothetical protein